MSQIKTAGQRYQDAVRFLYERINYEKLKTESDTRSYPFRLQRTRELIKRLGLGHFLFDPSAGQHPKAAKVPLIHIAGTKGKGSTATMVASILTASGLRTGVYTSPHLSRLEERFQIDGLACDESDFVAIIERIRPSTLKVESDGFGQLSFFELTTAIALQHFHSQKCDAVVLEVGLGGRLDSTNVCLPSVTAITSIGLDHQRVLGDTLAQIATEKAGIIKPNIPVVSGVRGGDAAEVIREIANERSASLTQLGHDFEIESRADSIWGSQIRFQSLNRRDQPITAHLAMEGIHQASNASIAIQICDILGQQNMVKNMPHISDEVIQQGLSKAQCPARLERFRLDNGVTVVIDSAHNEDSIQAFCDAIGGRPRMTANAMRLVFGTSRDKDARCMLKILAQFSRSILLTQYQGNPRFYPISELAEIANDVGFSDVHAIADPVEAMQASVDDVSGQQGSVVVCGSFFLAAETRPWVLKRRQPRAVKKSIATNPQVVDPC